MRRREFITTLGVVAATWLSTGLSVAQETRVIGIPAGTTETDAQAQRRVLAFTQALKELGWIEGKNIKLEKRYSAGNPERLPASPMIWFSSNLQ